MDRHTDRRRGKQYTPSTSGRGYKYGEYWNKAGNMPTSGQIRYSMQNKNINILDNSFK